jgi:hypothetical protein
VQELLNRLEGLPGEEKRSVLYHLLRELLGEHPQEEVGIYGPDGREYVYLLPPQLRLRLSFLQDPGLKTALDGSMRSSRRKTTAKEIITRAKARSK